MASRLTTLVLAALLTFSGTAQAAGPLVDRLVAVVDRRPIFLSELKERGTPHLRRIQAMDLEAVRRDVMIAEMYRELLSRLVDEEIVRRDAERLQLSIDESDVDAGIAMITKNSGITKEQLEKAVREQGMTMQQYREEVGRQVLEGKWVQAKLRSSSHAPKAGGSDADYAQALEKFRRKLLDELRERAYVEVML